MGNKSEYLQIRVTPQQKAALKRRASHAGRDMSSYVLARALPRSSERFAQILGALREGENARHALAELNDFLVELAPVEFVDALAPVDLEGMSAFLRNYVAAMVEVAATRKGVRPPEWTKRERGLPEPWFASPLRGHRLHLLRTAPIPFKRRNLFVDATVGDRV